MNSIKVFFESFGDGIKEFGETIGIIINSILLSVVYILGVGLTSIFIKLSKKTLLEDKISLSKKSYWEPVKKQSMKKEDYYRQF
jgi:hypothetical protein